jgi:hypothetical protein
MEKFSFKVLPKITSVSKSRGSNEGGQKIEIKGTGFV